ncbi:MAG: Ig-like domain-containing protein [Propionibacteriaceae bacterium]|jgi:hypothetical protein|nr:Ig-like domain-containing protein [Propionibacteriaceae bacterium]
MGTILATSTNRGAKSVWWHKPLAGGSAFLLAIGGLLLGQNPISAAQPEALSFDAATAASGLTNQGFDPHWTLAPEIKANWLHELDTDSVYWATDWSTGAPAQVGDTAMMLGQSFDFADDASTYQTRPAMEFERTTTGPATFTSYLQFSTQAIAPIGGAKANPGAPLTVYFWAHDGSDNVNPSLLNCASLAPGLTAANTITVARVTSGQAEVYVGCMPAPDARTLPPDPTSPANEPWATGGEGDQLTGFIYAQTQYGAFDSLTGANRGLNTEDVTFTVWDPQTGNYSQSGPIQPADLDMTAPATSMSRERMLASAQTDNPNCPNGTDGAGAGCTYAPSYAAADFGLDALGNIYIYTGQESGLGMNGNMALLRVSPTKDAAGSIISASADQPWRYNVVTKLTKASTASMFVQLGDYMVGTGIHNGHFLGGGYVSAYDTASATFPPNASNTIPASNQTAARMVNINPLTGELTLSGSTANAKASDSLHGSYSMAQDVLPGAGYRDDASAQMLTVISGRVYNDANGDGAIAGEDEIGLPGQTIVVAANGQLIGQQTTAEDGSYQLIMPGNGSYEVGVVQPQIGGVNAAQTYAGTSGTLNKVTFHCQGGDLAAESGVCAGALATPYTAPSLADITASADPSNWPVHASVQVAGSSQLAIADFGLTTMGSYGDGALGPQSVAAGAPVHVNGPEPTFWLGDQLGAYAGPASDNSHLSDDGVTIDSYLGPIALDGATLASTHSYNLTATLSGSASAQGSVSAWLADGSTWSEQAAWTPTSSGQTASGPFQLATTAAPGENPVQLRVNASTSSAALATNANGDYQAASADSSKAWLTSGEIEDYSLTAAEAVIRTAVNNPGDTASFTVTNGSNSDTLQAGGDQPIAMGPAVAVSAGSTSQVSVSASDPELSVTAAFAKDTTTGESLPATINTDGGQATVSLTVNAGDDITVEVVYGQPESPLGPVDPSKSSFTITPTPDPLPSDPALITATNWPQADGLTAYTGTFTAHDGEDRPLPDLDLADIAFSASSRQVQISDVINHHDGSYTVSYTTLTASSSTKAALLYDGAPIGQQEPIPFKAGAPKPGPFDCADGRSGTHLTVETPVLLPASSTATALVTDAACNPIPGVVVSFNLTKAGSAQVSPETTSTDANGQALATVSDSVAETVSLQATMANGQIDRPKDISFTTIAPAAPIILTPKDGLRTNADPLPISGVGQPGATVTVSDSSTDSSGESTTEPICTAKVDMDGQWSCQASLADGDHTLTARQANPAGASSSPSAPVRVHIDTTAPAAPTIDIANGDQVTGDLTGPIDPGTTVTIKDDDDQTICVATVEENGFWQCLVPDDTNSGPITAVATDPVGNVSQPGHGLIDTEAPDAPQLDPSTGDAFTGSGEAGGTVTITGPDGQPVPGCEAVLIDQNGDFSCRPQTPLRPGDRVTATVTDPAGNVSDPTTITIDSPQEPQPPTDEPTGEPTEQPSQEPSEEPTDQPTEEPTKEPSAQPSPSAEPSGDRSDSAQPTADSSIAAHTGGTADAAFPWGLLVTGGLLIAGGLTISLRRLDLRK